MCSEMKWCVVLMCLLASCTSYRNLQKINSGEVAIGLAVAGDRSTILPEREEISAIDSIRSTLSDGTIIMNAIRDSETGEMVATDVIRASKVTASFRNVAERGGYVTIGFDVEVPEILLRSDCQLRISPVMRLQEDTLGLDQVFITGKTYRQSQLRGYQRYRAFVASIITDTTDLVRMGQLELFIRRHFPETYAMKNDTSIVPEPLAENLFGVTQREAAEHYRWHWKTRRNEWKKDNLDRIYRKYVRVPIAGEGVRLDTVVAAAGTFQYRYTQTFRSRPGLKKVQLQLNARLFRRDECLAHVPFTDELSYYISSLSTLVDMRPKYRMEIVERDVYDHTKALIDFGQGSCIIDTCLSENSSELKRIRKCVDDVRTRKELVLDSLVISASCSPEGAYKMNERLSQMRAAAVKDYISKYIPEEWENNTKMSSVPENWEQFRRLIRNDSLLDNRVSDRIMKLTDDLSSPDYVEKELSGLPQYRYLREKVYPKLRSVDFRFYMHRRGVAKDTVHVREVDSVYMSGVEALSQLDYKKAVTVLRPYKDYNTALAFLAADYNHSALAVLEKLDDTVPEVCYLKAVVLSRLQQGEEALKYLKLSVAYDPHLRFRANLDPEMSVLAAGLEE